MNGLGLIQNITSLIKLLKSHLIDTPLRKPKQKPGKIALIMVQRTTRNSLVVFLVCKSKDCAKITADFSSVQKLLPPTKDTLPKFKGQNVQNSQTKVNDLIVKLMA